MKSVEIADAAASLATYAQGAGKQPVVLTQKGKPVAAIVGLDGLDMEMLSLGNNPKFLALIEKSRARHKAEGGTSSADMRRLVKHAGKRRK